MYLNLTSHRTVAVFVTVLKSFATTAALHSFRTGSKSFRGNLSTVIISVFGYCHKQREHKLEYPMKLLRRILDAKPVVWRS